MLALILEYRDEAQSVFAWTLCIAALIWGGGPERAVALVWLILFKVVDGIRDSLVSQTFRPDQFDAFSASIDMLGLAIMVLVAVRANRVYPMWIAAFQVWATLSHFANVIGDHVSPIAYVIMAVTPGYFQLILLAGGLIAHIRRTRRHGDYRDWHVQVRSRVFNGAPGAAR